MYCVQVPEIMNPILFFFYFRDGILSTFVSCSVSWWVMIWLDNETVKHCYFDHCWIGWFQFTFLKSLSWNVLELKQTGTLCLVGAALSFFFSFWVAFFLFFFLMFPDSGIVQCGAEAHSHQVDRVNIKGHSVPYVDGAWRNSQFIYYFIVNISRIVTSVCKQWLALCWNRSFSCSSC